MVGANDLYVLAAVGWVCDNPIISVIGDSTRYRRISKTNPSKLEAKVCKGRPDQAKLEPAKTEQYDSLTEALDGASKTSEQLLFIGKSRWTARLCGVVGFGHVISLDVSSGTPRR